MMKKEKMMLAGLATVALIGSTMNAKADEVGAITPASDKESAQSSVTEVDVASAKNLADKADKAVQAQKDVVEKATAQVSEAEQAVTTAEQAVASAEKLMEEASPEGIEKAKEAVSEAEKSVETANTKLDAEKEAKATIDEEVRENEEVVASSQKAVEEKEEAVSTAQSDVEKAQAILDGTGQAQIVKEAEQAAATLAQAQKDFATAQADLKSAQEADSKRLEAISKAETQVATATQDVTEKSALAEKASAKATQTASTLTKAEEAFKVAKNDLEALNIITMSDEYVTALRNYAKTYSKDHRLKLDALSENERAKNIFKANANDAQTVLDTNNVSEAVQTELSLFASDLINQIRQRFGTTPTTVTKDAVRLADLTANGYVSDNWSWNDTLSVGHDAKAVNRAAKELGLRTSSTTAEERGDQYYENLNTWGKARATMNLTDAKRAIYESILNFMFNGYEYLHATSIAGLSDGGRYLGVDLSSRTGVHSVHFLTVADSDIQADSSFDTQTIDNPHSAERVQATYQTAQSALTKAREENKQAQAEKMEAVQAQALAQRTLKTAQATLETAQATPVLTPTAQAKFVNAEEKLSTSEKANTKAQEALASLEADVKVKQANLTQAKQVLAEKEAELQTVQMTLKQDKETLALSKARQATAQAKVVQAEKEVALANKALEQAKAYLSSLEHAPENLQVAQATLKAKQEDLSQKQAILKVEEEKLAQLTQEQAHAQAQYQRVLKAYQVYVEAQRQLEIERQRLAIEQAGGQAIPIVNEAGQVTGYQKAEEASVQTVSSSQARLPETGDSVSLLSVLGMGVINFFGLTGRRRKVQTK